MWDSNSPLQLLKTMPRKLSKENLEKLQLVIDADKYKNSLISGFDLCGMYAPFCRDCKKTSIFPCAIAYINMMKAGGADIEIDARPIETTEGNVPEVVQAQAVPEIKEEEEVPVVEETAVAAVTEEVEENAIEEESVEEIVAVKDAPPEISKPSLKHKIRIAVARRKM